MKIAFVSKNKDLLRGSYRIWINDLKSYLDSINIQSDIKQSPNDKYDVIIYDKGLNSNILSDKKIGIINPPSDSKQLIKKVDFVIVGSCEEKESMIQYNKNIFIFPLIEQMYLNITPKIHTHKQEIVIGYQGNQYHLNHLSLGLKNALERLNKDFKIKFVYICQNNKEWLIGKPKINTEFKKWNIKTIVNDIQQFDIGVVPNISEITQSNKLDTDMKKGIYNTDIKIRFKNKSNIGRSLVLFQLGIPVVADITPSNMHILANPDNGYAVLGEDGWYQALKELCCEKRRNFVSQNAYNECKRLYDPLVWAKRLIDNIKKL